MITVVVTINILISLILLYIAWRVWLLKRSFTNLKNAFNAASRNSYAVLSTLPNFLYARQTVIKNLRQRNQGLESQFQKSTQALSILLIVSRFWRRRGQ
ncbi:hypothetical protein NIES2101_34635 [Calothrix sp. HK-06]|nr:hypothetical protein NIES2101_34635 [Calothrix sp. HK-06]